MPPIEGFYRYHLIYFGVSSVLSWAFYPYQVYVSFGLMALLCIVGLAFLFVDRYVLSQVVALAVGLAAPIIFFGQLTLWWTMAVFGVLLAGGYAARDLLFFP